MAYDATPKYTAQKSCMTCPAMIDPSRQASAAGGLVGSPMCGRFMKVLTRPTQPIEVAHVVLKDTANKCAEYGKEIKLVPLTENAAVFLNVGIDTSAKEQTALDSIQTPNCNNCANFVPASDVRQAFGWLQPMCKATGSLMIDAKLHNNAKQCGKFVTQAGPRGRDKLEKFLLLPQFSSKYGVVDLAKKYIDAISGHVDRAKYVTDRNVGVRAKAAGIRAWRAVEDPQGYGETVYLPIFDPDAKVEVDGKMEPLFTKAELEKIPQTHDSEHPELYADHGGLIYRIVVLLMKLDETPALWGQGGTGKTEIGRHIAWLCGLPFNRISINAASEIDDIAGKYLFVNNETVIHWGRLARAWQRPCVTLLDEPNTGPNDIWQLCRSLTDNSRTMVVDHLDATRIIRHIYCMFMMALNPAWDVRNGGTHDVADADLSRLSHIFFDLPPRDLEMAIIRKRVELDGWVIPEDRLKMVMEVAKQLRLSSQTGALQTTWGVRHNIRAARNLRFFNGPLAYRTAIADALEPAQLELVLNTVRSQFGD
jgi:hypothetical protein